MKETGRYIYVYAKRIMKICPVVIIGTVILCAAILFGTGMLLNNSNSSTKKIEIGVVGELDNSFFQSGISALESLDSSRYIIDLEQMEEDKAREKLRDGELTAYIIIPDGFVEAVIYGDNDKVIEYVCEQGQAGLMGNVMEELIDSFSRYIIESQSGVYAVLKAAVELRKRELSDKELLGINARYIGTVLSRDKMCEVETIGVGHNLSLTAYYFCGLLTVILMLCGINSCTYFVGRSKELQKMYMARGHKIYEQIIGEFVPYFGLMLVIFISIWLTVSLAIAAKMLYIEEWNDSQLGTLWVMLPKMLPVALFVSLIHFLIYELIDNVIGSILFQFILSICLGYISGCFYPDYFFPELLQNVTAYMPFKVIMRYIAECIRCESVVVSMIMIALYIVVCAGMVLIIRSYKVKGELV